MWEYQVFTGNPVPEVEGKRQEVSERSVMLKISAQGLLLQDITKVCSSSIIRIILHLPLMPFFSGSYCLLDSTLPFITEVVQSFQTYSFPFIIVPFYSKSCSVVQDLMVEKFFSYFQLVELFGKGDSLSSQTGKRM